MWSKYYPTTPFTGQKCGLTYRLSPRLLPSSLDLSNSFSSLKDQGQIGSCVAFSIVSVCEYILKREGLLPEEDYLSERFLYYQSLFEEYQQIPEPTPGIDVLDALKVAYKSGIPTERSFPYFSNILERLSGNVEMKGKPSKEVYEEAKRFRISGYASLRAFSVQDRITQIKRALGMGLPPIVVIDGGPGSISWRSHLFTGILEDPRKVEWRHCVVIVGYDDKAELLKFRNTWNGWGVEWGDDGFGYIRYSSQSISEAYILTGVRTRDEDSEQIAIQRLIEAEQVQG